MTTQPEITHEITHEIARCLDCGDATWVASNEPEENQRCVPCFSTYMRRSR